MGCYLRSGRVPDGCWWHGQLVERVRPRQRKSLSLDEVADVDTGSVERKVRPGFGATPSIGDEDDGERPSGLLR